MSRIEATDKKGPSPPSSMGQAGVNLKQFEAVLTKILLHDKSQTLEQMKPTTTENNNIEEEPTSSSFELPSYMKFPLLQKSNFSLDSKVFETDDCNWPFNLLPPAASICGKPERVWKKEAQIRCIIQCVLNMLPDIHNTNMDRRLKIVDFGGGGGNLALPLAILLPQCDVVVVDLKLTSLLLARRRAALCREEISQSMVGKDPEHVKYNEEMVKNLYRSTNSKRDDDLPKNMEISCEGLQNLKLFHGDIRSFNSEFHLGLALHACGQATDLAMNKSCQSKAAFVVAPCCVGKLNRNRINPYMNKDLLEQTTSDSEIDYPRSELFKSRLQVKPNEFDKLASAGDYGEAVDMRTSRGAFRRAAKTLLEFDRISWVKDLGYKTILTRMHPWEASPKNDIIIGWLPTSAESKRNKSFYSFSFSEVVCSPCDESNEDIQIARHYLLGRTERKICNSGEKSAQWTKEEIEEVQQKLSVFITNASSKKIQDSNIPLSSMKTMVFPAGLGSRKRKLVHHLAETLGLKHWSTGGKRNQERSVVVAIKSESSS